jgi:hypothetical protein
LFGTTKYAKIRCFPSGGPGLRFILKLRTNQRGDEV